KRKEYCPHSARRARLLQRSDGHHNPALLARMILLRAIPLRARDTHDMLQGCDNIVMGTPAQQRPIAALASRLTNRAGQGDAAPSIICTRTSGVSGLVIRPL